MPSTFGDACVSRVAGISDRTKMKQRDEGGLGFADDAFRVGWFPDSGGDIILIIGFTYVAAKQNCRT